MRGTRRVITASFGVVAVLVVASGAAALACANLATLQLSTPAASPGAHVKATAAASGPLVLHWDGPHGVVLAEATPDADGRISAAFTVPATDLGRHKVVATRVGPQGTDSRVPAAVSPLDVRAPVHSAPWRSGGPLPNGGGTAAGPLVAVAAAGALGAGLVAAGAARVASLRVGATAPAPRRASRR